MTGKKGTHRTTGTNQRQAGEGPGHRSRLPGLPPQPTSFIGREAETAEITTLLADPACRLLTLVGPGGIGKSRLAIQAAGQMGDPFSDGVHHVALQSLDDPDLLLSTIADSLNLPLSGQEEPGTQLLNYLSDKEMLLVLDNVEHLLAGTHSLSHLLQAAPAAKLLVTSREALNLQEEWVRHVPGMDFPEREDAAQIESYSALQLFVERARQVRGDFSLAEEQAGVVRICQLVGGMPLALELAAAWTKTLPCDVIVDEIQRNIDFLATSLRNVPDRHRSMQAVFNQSWELMNRNEQNVFQRLAVFRGGFDRQAAAQVAGASLSILSALVDKSLLGWGANGRYQIHKLLRQYAREKSGQSADTEAATYEQHARYFADFLQQRFPDLLGRRQIEAIDEIAAELENIRAAWEWVLSHEAIEALRQMVPALDSFYQYRSRFLEGTTVMEQAVACLEQHETERPFLAEVLVYLGWYRIRMGRFEAAEKCLQRSLRLFTENEVPLPPGVGIHPLIPLAVLAQIRGELDRALGLAQQARQIVASFDDRQNLAGVYYVLASVSLAQGKNETAAEHARHACQLAQSVNDRWFMAYTLNELGHAARAMGNYAEAKRHYQDSYAIREAFDDAEGMAVALNHLGQVALFQEAPGEAKQLYQQSLAIYRDINDRGGLATTLAGLGKTAVALGDYETARQHCLQALETAVQIQFVPLILSLLIGIGELLVQTGRVRRGLELLAVVRHHPASEQETKELAQKRLDRYRNKLTPQQWAQITGRSQESSLETVVDVVKTELAVMEMEAETAANRETIPPEQPLTEPLTPRELEVLQLIADGLTNRAIAEKLVISVGTVKWYTSQIYGKLGVNSRTQAVAQARELKLLAG